MIRPQVLRLFVIPMMLLTLLACNLSASTSIETPQTIVTATPVNQASLEITSTPIDESPTTVQPTVTEPSHSQSVNHTTTTTGDLYYVYGNRPQTLCGVQATITTNIRISPTLSSGIQGQLVGDEWLPVFNEVNGWYQINLPNTPVHQLWISTAPTILDNSCTCDAEACSRSTVQTVCDIATHPDTTTQIHTEPSNWSSVVGELIPETLYRAIAQSSSGWYQLEIGGWIPPNYIKSTSNDNSCRDLQTITYDAPLFNCELVNTTSEIVVILNDPNGEYFGRFGVGLKLGVIKKEGDWVQVYVPAFSNAGWVDGSEMSLVGDCASF